MRASIDSEYITRDRNTPITHERSRTAFRSPSTGYNSATSYTLPRPMEPEPLRAAWTASQRTSPSLSRPNTHQLTLRRRPEAHDEQMQRLPGVQELLEPESHLSSPSSHSQHNYSYLPPLPRISPTLQHRETPMMVPRSRRDDLNILPNRSLPPSPLSDDHQSFIPPQQSPYTQANRFAYIPSYSGRFQHGLPIEAMKTDFEQPSNILTSPDYKPPPRCLGEREIEGEGSCWIFDDGTYCKTVVDGEPVNPSWGVTKAGKARKRLAQACLTCREKKIKCEPAFPKCTQCEKTGKVCKQ